MGDLNIEELLSAAQKKQARAAMADWLDAEIEGLVRIESQAWAQRWLRGHKKELEAMFDAEIQKRLPAAIKQVATNMFDFRNNW